MKFISTSTALNPKLMRVLIQLTHLETLFERNAER